LLPNMMTSTMTKGVGGLINAIEPIAFRPVALMIAIRKRWKIYATAFGA
jgi:hypothetical protein